MTRRCDMRSQVRRFVAVASEDSSPRLQDVIGIELILGGNEMVAMLVCKTTQKGTLPFFLQACAMLDTSVAVFDPWKMFTFARQAPFDLTSFNDPGMEVRSGPPLTRGSLFTLLGTVAGDALSTEAHAAIRRLDAEAWYHGQLLETLLNMLEERDPEMPEFVGRNIYFMFRTPLQHVGINTATDLIKSMTTTWLFATRGDSGEFRSRMIADKHWIVEGEQPYNCVFEGGALRGFIEAFDGHDVQIEHSTCRRKGDRFCTYEVRWQE